MTRDDFYNIEAAELSQASFRFVQTKLLDMSNIELAEALGFPDREKGRKFVSAMRSGSARITPPIVTAMWFLVFSDDAPAWVGE